MSAVNNTIVYGKVNFGLNVAKKDDTDPKKSTAIGKMSIYDGKDRVSGESKWVNLKFQVKGYAAHDIIDAIAIGNKPGVLISGKLQTNTWENKKFSDAEGNCKKEIDLELFSFDAKVIEGAAPRGEQVTTQSSSTIEEPLGFSINTDDEFIL